MTCKRPNVGGQAVIEGVMMRGTDKVAVAVRKPDGEIAVDVNPVNSIRDKYPILKKPLLRGVIALFESLIGKSPSSTICGTVSNPKNGVINIAIPMIHGCIPK